MSTTHDPSIYRDVGFVHLHVHSSFSLLEGALPIGRLAELAKADAMPALALTDTNNLFGALEFSEKFAEKGIQPIVGLQLTVDFGDHQAAPGRPHAQREGRGRLVLLAKDEAGYRNLMRLTSIGFMESDSADEPHVMLERLLALSDGLIALTGGPDGPIDKLLAAGRDELAERRLFALKEGFPSRLYVELQRHGTESERAVEPRLLSLAYAHRLPLVAANEPFFGGKKDHEAHDALVAIAEGRLVSDDDRRKVSAEHGFKTRAEMQILFKDLPEALQNTIEISMRCSHRPRVLKTPILPRFSESEDEAALLKREAHAGLDDRFRQHRPVEGMTEENYRERLDFELSVIERMKFPGYFLIVSDFIRWAKEQGIPVGPGRGSGAGSLVAYALKITDLDPLRFNLLFERFLNPDRVSMPDFDIDFCQDRREEVIRYVQDRYGHDRVAQIITFGSLQARGVMRDVGRVLEMPYGQVDKLTKLVPQNPANPVTLEKAIAEEARLRAAADEDPNVERMLGIALKLEGLYRHASTHAAGIVIGDRRLEEMVPLYRDPKSEMPVTQFNMKWVEQAGLVKFDFLGLKTLSVLDMAVKLLAKRGIAVDLLAIPLDDARTYAMLSRAEAVGIFQLESGGMRRALADMKPDRFEDIIALVALYRPGPMANIPVYCDCKHKRAEPEYIHPQVKSVLEETFGVIVYQEQVMQIAQILSGYSLGEADLLRRAMGKKIKAEMDKQRERFVTGCIANCIAEADANTIFDLLAKFADYGFNKSHAAAYALVAYQTAWMKANHPTEFLAASMAYETTNTDKLVEFRREAERLGIVVEAPSILSSGVSFDVQDGKIVYALSAVKGVGVEAARQIVQARPFRSLGDFASRINPRAVNKRTIETLAAAGAFDALEPNRARIVAGADLLIACANEAERSRADGQTGLFGGDAGESELRLPNAASWTPMERLQREFAAIGFFLSGHPLDDYAPALERMRISTQAVFLKAVRAGAGFGRLAATVIDRQERRTRTGTRMGIITLSDQSGQFEVVAFAERLAQFRDLLEPGKVVLVTVSASVENEDARLIVQAVEGLDQAIARGLKGLRVFVRSEEPLESLRNRLTRKGDGDIYVVVMAEGEDVEVKLPGRYDVSPAMVGALKSVSGVMAVQPV
ncbi:MAG: DNA polymerase III subunit alpha [Methylocystis sp.]|nr:DNA polymerase III subunit alpha [Methylocystis sp.]MCA3584071.1 DNA polymerase III subunit alpha [Methylocystis sp.]MCA3587039.1 DNA polymerase III subunit alpha [Methylocystis sp.]MCA3591191.1 DNA polymerase III subunit alpha [Methylocystis sp.]